MKPHNCPHCDAPPEVFPRDGSIPPQVYCVECADVDSMMAFGATEEKAIADWNGQVRDYRADHCERCDKDGFIIVRDAHDERDKDVCDHDD